MKSILTLILFFSLAITYCQQLETVDFTKIKAQLEFDYPAKTVSGDLVISLKMISDADFIYLDAKNILKYDLLLDGKLVNTYPDDNRIFITKNFKAGTSHEIKLNYQAKPDKALYFVNNGGFQQIWSQGQGKYTSNWLPSIDDMNDKIEFDLSIVTLPGVQVISNGSLVSKEESLDQVTWHYDMEKPMSSYLVAVALGDYRKNSLKSSSGVPLEMYYYPEDSLKVLTTYKYTTEIFDFLEEEIGVPFPWSNYKQVPVKDFLYAGMENTTATIFSDQYVIDRNAFLDRNYVNVNAHEMAHQWFGDLVTETSGTHHWLHEGFATYYALLAERKVFGEDQFYWQLYQSAEDLKELSDKGKGEKLLNPGAGSLTFYQKGAWALHILREKIGDESFKNAVRNYLEKNKFGNVNTEDFLAEARAASGSDLVDFEKDWLQQKAFMATEALESLKKSPFIKKYMEVVALRKVPFSRKQNRLMDLLALPDDYIGQEAVYQLAGEPISQTLRIYERAFYTNNPYVRQAIAVSVPEVPAAMKVNYERLLNDDSYVTRENALLALWSSFPASRHQYLEKTKGVVGLPDRNIEILWLSLAIATLDYEEAYVRDHFFRLTRYTGERYPFAVRENAFQKLFQLQLYDERSLKNLVSGCLHHNWRFAQSCRGILDMLLKDPSWKKMLQNLELSEAKEQEFLNQKLT